MRGIGWQYTIFVSYTLTNRDAGLLVGILKDHDLGQLNAESVVRAWT